MIQLKDKNIQLENEKKNVFVPQLINSSVQMMSSNMIRCAHLCDAFVGGRLLSFNVMEDIQISLCERKERMCCCTLPTSAVCAVPCRKEAKSIIFSFVFQRCK